VRAESLAEARASRFTWEKVHAPNAAPERPKVMASVRERAASQDRPREAARIVVSAKIRDRKIIQATETVSFRHSVRASA